MTDPTEVGATKMAEILFTSRKVDEFKEKTGLTVRQIWEIASTKTQCNNTVGQLGEDTDCWICGFPIEVNAGAGRGLAPECEHVLPVVQARFFLTLYNTDMKEDSLQGKAKEVLKLEYAWAHTICNQEKGNVSFIQSNPDTDFSVNTAGIRTLLKNIYKSKRFDSGILKNQIDRYINNNNNNNDKNATGSDAWKKYRSKIITKRITDIIQYLKNGRPEGIYNLLLITGTVDSISPENLNKKFAKLLENNDVRTFVEYVKQDVGSLLETETQLLLRRAKDVFSFTVINMKRKREFYQKLFGIVQLDKDSIIQSLYNNMLELSKYYTSVYEKFYNEEPSIAAPLAIEFVSLLIYGYLYNKTIEIKDSEEVGIDKLFLYAIKYNFYNILNIIVSRPKISLININYLLEIVYEKFPSFKTDIEEFLKNKNSNINMKNGVKKNKSRKRPRNNLNSNSNSNGRKSKRVKKK
jgi:hypothetical protein